MQLLQSLTLMTRTLHSVTVAGMFATVPMVLLPKMRSETLYFTTYSSSADSMDPACLGPLVHAVLAMYSLLNAMKSVVASQNIFLGGPGVYTGTTSFAFSRRPCIRFSISAKL